MSDSSQHSPEGQKPRFPWKVFFLTYFGALFLIVGTIWVTVKAATFIYNHTIGSGVDSFFAENSTEQIIFWAWLISASLFIGNVLRNK
jgi:hypothetical protein